MKKSKTYEYQMYRHGDSECGKTDWVIKNSMESLQKTDFEEYRKFWGDEFRWTRITTVADEL